VEKGLIDEHSKIGEQEMYNLIMQPGFSTVDKITDISGRGVGLDVVAINIQSLRGSFDIESTPGKGTKFFIMAIKLIQNKLSCY
jgi:two-component system chemotaxis sensor kinase CheA